LALALAVLCVYAGRLSGPFLFDDQQAIVDNLSLRSAAPIQLLSPPRETPVAGRPLVNLSFALDRALFGLSPGAFHTSNLCLHLACAWLVFLIVFGALRAPSTPESVGKHAQLYAFVTALCFAVHPLAAEIVLYTSQRTEALVALWYLTTFYLLVREASDPAPHSRRWLWVMLVGLLGAASKEVFASALPIALYFDRAFFAGSFSDALRLRKRFYLALSTSLLPLGLLQLDRPRPDSVRFAEFDYLLAQAEVIPRYFAVAVWPSRLALDYGPLWPDATQPAWPWIVGTTVAIVGCGAIAVRRPRLGFLPVWIFGILAPSSSVFSIHTEVGAERRFYLPLAALLAYAVVACGEFWSRSWQRQRGRGLAALFAALVVVALAARARARASDFLSVRSAWQSAVRARPQNARAHYNLAETYRREGDLPAAIAAFGAAIAAHEAYPDAHGNLAGALLASGDSAGALSHLQRATALSPSDPTTRVNYATALGVVGDTEGAVRELNAALRLRPDSLEIHRRLAVGLSMLGRTNDAREHARWVLSRAERDPTALRVLLDPR
jgi:Flp pilus assembly protein TadD